MLWQKDGRLKSGGYWVCRAKRREYNQRRHTQRIAWMRDKYNADAGYRIQFLERNSASKRARQRANKKQGVELSPRMAVFLKAVRPKGG